MDDSIAILGRQPALGLAELESLYGDKVTPVGDNAARIGIMPCSIDFSRLGGSVKLCKMLATLDTTNWKEIEKFLINTAPAHSQNMPAGKMHLGLSVYGLPVLSKQLLATGLKMKNAINQQTGRTVRLVPNKTTDLNTAQVLHNKLTGGNGWELVFVRQGDKTLVAQTLFIQDIESYTLRDRGRPRRDARVGMLPPKLAQIIINLAIGPDEFEAVGPELSGDICLTPEDNRKLRAARARTTLLDPFCGTGVLLQEAALMGYGTYGTDLEPRMVGFSQQNHAWLKANFPVDSEPFAFTPGDATEFQWKPEFQTIASEVYLGRPFTARPTTQILEQTIAECNLILKKFLKNLHNQIQPGARLCLAIPAWQIQNDIFKHLPLIDQIEELGYNRISFEHVPGDQLLYYREDQIVARELLVLTKQ